MAAQAANDTRSSFDRLGAVRPRRLPDLECNQATVFGRPGPRPAGLPHSPFCQRIYFQKSLKRVGASSV
jgi:hypothetical protein